jgi:hypothetical protein
MLLLRSTLLLWCSFVLAGCGFSPLYAKPDAHGSALSSVLGREDEPDVSSEIGKALASVEITGLPQTRTAQELRMRLEDLLNPRGADYGMHYKLTLELEEDNTPSAIQQNREITRFNVVVSTRYALYDGDTLLAKGVVRLNGSYDAVDSQYATFIASQDTTHRIAQEVAESLKLRLLAAFEKYFAKNA